VFVCPFCNQNMFTACSSHQDRQAVATKILLLVLLKHSCAIPSDQACSSHQDRSTIHRVSTAVANPDNWIEHANEINLKFQSTRCLALD
jgi:hypothetical protein